MNDGELLAHYVSKHSESAFAELVQRHVDFVYRAALRRVSGDVHLARDIAQSVFIVLARDAPSIRDRRLLLGWLYGTTRFVAGEALRRERRDRQRLANVMPLIAAEGIPEGNPLCGSPLIDRALDSLRDQDRQVVILRYFERASFADIGSRFHISEDAARMRTERALERLKTWLQRRGVSSSSAAIGATLAAEASFGAPIGLGGSIAAAAMSGTAAPIGIGATLGFMSITKTAIASTALALFASGLVIYERQELRTRAAEIAVLSQKLAAAQAELAKAVKANSQLKSLPAAIEIPRGTAAFDGPQNAAGAAIVSRMMKAKLQIQQTPQWSIPELAFLTDEDWISALNGLPLETEGQMRWALSEARMAAKKKFVKLLVSALAAYSSANGGTLPEDLAAAAPYFKDPLDPAILGRYVLLKNGDFATASSNGRDFLADKPDSAVDEAYDTMNRYGTGGFSGGQANRSASIFHTLITRYREANGDRTPGTIEELRPYIPALPGSFDFAALESFLPLEQRPSAR